MMMSSAPSKNAQHEQQLREIFDACLAAVSGHPATAAALEHIELGDRIRLLAFGKAADSMVQGALPLIGERLQAGLLVTKHGHLTPTTRAHPLIECIESGHPVPNAASLVAGDAVCRFVRETADSDHLLVLISGGGSALVESLVDGSNLQDLQARTDALLASGAAIGEVNRERRQLSRIKGGGLLKMLGGCRVTQLLISDVPGDRLADIASGPLVAPTDSGYAASQVETQLVATNAIARSAAADKARSMGFSVTQADGSLDGDVHSVAERLVNALPRESGELVIFGGESTVVLPEQSGEGGRNQHLAALMAHRIQGQSDLAVLVCGTDGTDGPTDAAGGIVTTHTVERGGAEALARALDEANTGVWLSNAGAVVRTGPTGTNVMDVAFLVRGSPVNEAADTAGQ